MKIQVILGSTRQGRITERLAKWIVSEASKIEDFELELVDLADYEMPFFTESVSPRYNPNPQHPEPVARLLAKLSEGDGYVITTPEYNHSIPAVLKNMFDYLTAEIAKKPVLVASHGSVGGARAAEHLKVILLEAGAAVVPPAVAMHGASELLDGNGVFLGDTTAPYNHLMLLGITLGELKWWTQTLKNGRSAAKA
jgi:NAD(P)H-dependent FMN reductase